MSLFGLHKPFTFLGARYFDAVFAMNIEHKMIFTAPLMALHFTTSEFKLKMPAMGAPAYV
jgi:hypothetical protein